MHDGYVVQDTPAADMPGAAARRPGGWCASILLRQRAPQTLCLRRVYTAAAQHSLQLDTGGC